MLSVFGSDATGPTSTISQAKTSPFQATKLWNQLVLSFKSKVEPKKKRWKMKIFENCFSGNEALQVLHKQLQTNERFGTEVTREQACQLLQKFLDAGILKDVREKGATQFEADGHLYRICDSSLEDDDSTKQADSQQCVPHQSSFENLFNSKICQVEHQEKSVSLYGGRSLRSSKRKPFVSMTNIGFSPHGSNQMSRTATRSQSVSSPLPGAVDITPFCTPPRQRTRDCSAQCNCYLSDAIGNPLSDDAFNNANFQLTRSSSVRLCRQGAMRMKRNGKFYIHKDDIGEEDMNMELEDDAATSTEISRKRHGEHTETGPSHSPTKRQREFADANAYVNYAVIASAFENLSQEENPNPNARNKPSAPPLRPVERDIPIEEIEETWKSVAISSLKQILGNDASELISSPSISGRDVRANGGITKKEVSTCVPDWLLSAMKCLIRWPTSMEERASSRLPAYQGFERDVFNAIREHYQTTIKDSLIPRHFQSLLTSLMEMFTSNWLKALAILKYVCVLMPHRSRLSLQLLTRFINKLSRNDSIKLSTVLLNRELLVQTFHPLVFSFNNGKTDIEGIRLLTFMLDNSEEIFKLPRGLRFQVDHKLAVTHGSLMHNQNTNPSIVFLQPRAYCQQKSVEQHEAEGQLETKKAMVDLLNHVLQNNNMPPKEKKQFIKQFQKTYPAIYQDQIPESSTLHDGKLSQRSSFSSILPRK